MVIQLKKIERDLLYELSKNSNITLSRLGKKIRTSKQVLSYNINKLIKDGVIIRYFPIIDYNLLDLIELRIMIKFGHITPEKEKLIIAFIKKESYVKKILKVDNHFDLVVNVVSNNMLDFYNFIFNLEDKYGSFILEESIDIQAKKEFLVYGMFKEKIDQETHNCTVVYGDKKKVVLDNKDIQILEILEKDSKISAVNLALKLKINPKTILYRLKKLEKQGLIKGYSIFINWKKLGKVHYRILIDTYNIKKQELEDFLMYIRKNPGIIQINHVVSHYILEFDIISDNYNSIQDFIKELKRKFSKFIRSYDLLYIEEEI